ncbi:MAG: chloride channel protein [Spirochaetales bacterium]
MARSNNDNGDIYGLRGLRFAVIQSLVILTTAKWVFLAAIAGVIVGIPTAAFLLLLDGGIAVVYDLPFFFLLIPIGMLVSHLLVSRLAPEAKGHGTEQVIEAIHRRDGAIELKVVPVKMLATLVTLILGGSAGKEGPSAQIGAGVSSGFARILRMNKLDTQRFVLCGISAGFSGVFGTPIAGAVFASEVLAIGRFHYNRLLPALIASFVSVFVTNALGVGHFSFTVDYEATGAVLMLAEMVIFGLVMGMLAILFIFILTRTERVFEHVSLPGSVKALIGGVILIGVVLAAGTTNYIGLGMELINLALDGDPYRGIAAFAKMVTTSVTLSAGGSGGILTPVFFIGAMAGNFWAQLLSLDIAVYSAIGMIAFLAATTNTPIAATFMAIELFGLGTGSQAAIAAAVSYLIVGHLSVFPTQIIYQKKTFFADLEVHEVPVNFSWVGIKRVFTAFFRGYRNERDETLAPGGVSVAENERNRVDIQRKPHVAGQAYYPLSTVPHLPATPFVGSAERTDESVEEKAITMHEKTDIVREYVDAASRVCVLTGAGISAECGIPTFRDSQTGYWARFDPTQLATPEAFAANPARVWSWYAARRQALRRIVPGPGHLALVRMEGYVDHLTVVTQNVDGLHNRAGSSHVLDIHGNLLRVRCPNGCVSYHREEQSPEAQAVFAGDIAAAFAAKEAERDQDFNEIAVPKCPRCGEYLRPDVVWFGEMLPAKRLETAFAEAERCDLFFSIGTSAQVQPAASLPRVAIDRGVPVIEINPESTPLSDRVAVSIRAGAGDVLSRVL